MTSPVKVWRERQQRYRYLNKVGRLVSFTKVAEKPEGFSRLPYWVGIVEFEGKKRTTGQIVEVGDTKLKPGLLVRGVLRRIKLVGQSEVIDYGVKFVPVEV